MPYRNPRACAARGASGRTLRLLPPLPSFDITDAADAFARSR